MNINVKGDRKVVLQALREIPKEVMFKSTKNNRDQIKSNRWWFEFPPQWTNELDKDSVVGIRSMYVSRTNREIWFCVNIKFINAETNETWALYTITLRKYLDADETIKSLCSIWEEYYSDNVRIDIYNDKFVQPTLDRNMFALNYSFTDGQCILTISRPPEQSKQYYMTDPDDPTLQHLFNIEYEFVPMNDDTKTLFGDTSSAVGTLELPCWSRYQCYVTSSISDECTDSYLGHTRQEPYSPIKYYRLSGDSKKFWVDLYETRSHDVPVYLPSDNKDILIIEAIVCFNANSML